MSPVQADDLLLDNLGSALPDSTDWTLARFFLSWRAAVESRPMPAWEMAA